MTARRQAAALGAGGRGVRGARLAPAEGKVLRRGRSAGLGARRIGAAAPRWTRRMRRAGRSALCGPKPSSRRGRVGGRPRHPLRRSRPQLLRPGRLPRAPNSPMPSTAVTGAQRAELWPSQPLRASQRLRSRLSIPLDTITPRRKSSAPCTPRCGIGPSAGLKPSAPPEKREQPGHPADPRAFDQPLSRPLSPVAPSESSPAAPLRMRKPPTPPPASPGSLPRRHRLPRNILGPAGRRPRPWYPAG